MLAENREVGKLDAWEDAKQRSAAENADEAKKFRRLVTGEMYVSDATRAHHPPLPSIR
jgi:hypothetical protein